MKNKNFPFEEHLDKRVIFIDQGIRDKFFVILKEKLGSWQAIRTRFKMYRSRLENFRKGAISIPYMQFLEFCELIDKRDIKQLRDSILFKDANWGRIKGGKTTYNRYKEIFNEGRKINWGKLVKEVDMNITLTPSICEIIGAFIGDGFMNQYGAQYKLQITGDSRLDERYYVDTLMPVIKEISPDSNPSISRIHNTLRLTVYSKRIYKIFNERLGMKNGKKAYEITIPDEIIRSDDYGMINSCIRGIFDTDGCVAFDRRKGYAVPYVRIMLKMKSHALMMQLNGLLKVQGINPTLTKDGEVIQINGVGECRKFMKIIGFSNPRHLNKLANLL